MKMRTFAGGFALGCACMAFAAMNFAPQDPPMDEEAMMQAWMEGMEKYASPSEEHAELAKRVGKWNWRNEYFMGPGAPPEVVEGEADYMMMMGGRYLAGHYHADMEGMPFEGAGLTAYNRMKKEYQGMWIDNMSTAIMTSTGHKTGDGTYDYWGKMPNLMTGREDASRTIERVISDDKWVMESYSPAPDGSMYLSMRITYTRVVE